MTPSHVHLSDEAIDDDTQVVRAHGGLDLIGALERLCDGALAVASEQPSIVRILGVTGMDQVLDLHATPGEAIAAVHRGAEAKG